MKLAASGEKRITFEIPQGPHERNWYAVDRIGKYSSLLIHGDQFRGRSGIPVAAMVKKVALWSMGGIADRFDDVAFGHYHQPTRITVNTATVRCAGSPESDNSYASESLAAVGAAFSAAHVREPREGSGIRGVSSLAGSSSGSAVVRLPGFEVIGHGRRRWRVSIEVLPLAGFMAACASTFGAASGRLPVAFWCDSGRRIVLRLDRTPAQRVRDLKHELVHAVNDWLEAAYPDPGD